MRPVVGARVEARGRWDLPAGSYFLFQRGEATARFDGPGTRSAMLRPAAEEGLVSGRRGTWAVSGQTGLVLLRGFCAVMAGICRELAAGAALQS